MLSLQVIDQKWKDHLYAVDHLREGIWAMGYAQKDPLVEYRFQSFQLFEEMNESFKETLLEFLFKAELQEETLHEEMPEEYEIHGDAIHAGSEGYGVGTALQQGPPLASPIADTLSDTTVPFNSSIKGEGKAVQRASGGGSSRKKSSRRRKKR